MPARRPVLWRVETRCRRSDGANYPHSIRYRRGNKATGCGPAPAGADPAGRDGPPPAGASGRRGPPAREAGVACRPDHGRCGAGSDRARQRPRRAGRSPRLEGDVSPVQVTPGPGRAPPRAERAAWRTDWSPQPAEQGVEQPLGLLQVVVPVLKRWVSLAGCQRTSTVGRASQATARARDPEPEVPVHDVAIRGVEAADVRVRRRPGS